MAHLLVCDICGERIIEGDGKACGTINGYFPESYYRDDVHIDACEDCLSKVLETVETFKKKDNPKVKNDHPNIFEDPYFRR